jgi:hypothetical protein
VALTFPLVLGSTVEEVAKMGSASDQPQVRELIRTIACANPLWRTPRIRGELRKLGIEV